MPIRPWAVDHPEAQDRRRQTGLGRDDSLDQQLVVLLEALGTIMRPRVPIGVEPLAERCVLAERDGSGGPGSVRFSRP